MLAKWRLPAQFRINVALSSLLVEKQKPQAGQGGWWTLKTNWGKKTKQKSLWTGHNWQLNLTKRMAKELVEYYVDIRLVSIVHSFWRPFHLEFLQHYALLTDGCVLWHFEAIRTIHKIWDGHFIFKVISISSSLPIRLINACYYLTTFAHHYLSELVIEKKTKTNMLWVTVSLSKDGESQELLVNSIVLLSFFLNVNDRSWKMMSLGKQWRLYSSLSNTCFVSFLKDVTIFVCFTLEPPNSARNRKFICSWQRVDELGRLCRSAWKLSADTDKVGRNPVSTLSRLRSMPGRSSKMYLNDG